MPVTVKTFDRLRDAVSALSSDSGARFLGGGTLLVRRLNEGRSEASTLIRSTDRAIGEIRPSGSRVFIGAGATMARIAAHRDLGFLKAAANAVGGPAIRTMATVGGNICAPYPFGDFTVALLALEAKVSIQSGYNKRDVSLEDFLAGRGRDNRTVIAGVTFRRPDSERDFRFLKVTRSRPKGAAVLVIAANLNLRGGRMSSPRVAYGNMAPGPIRAKAVEAALNGKTLDKAGIAPALAVATDGCAPVSDPFATGQYRRDVLGVYLERLLLG